MSGPVIDVGESEPDDVAEPDEVADAPGTAVVPAHVAPPPIPSAMGNPNVTGRELAELVQMSELLADSTIVPRAYQGKPANVLVAGLTGRRFGWDVMTSMREGHVIEGTWALKAEAMVALVRQAGHSISGATSSEQATVTGRRADDGTTMTVTWTVADADAAKLLSKDVWRQYRPAMLWARAVSQLVRQLFSDVTMGMSYTPEELGARVDERGDVIDVPSDEAPSLGWSKPQGQAPADDGGYRPGDPAELLALQVDMAALPEGIRADLRKAWKGHKALGSWRPGFIPIEMVATARSMVNAHWARATKAGADIMVERLDVAERVVRGVAYGLSCALVGPGPVGGPDGAAAVSEGQEGAQGRPDSGVIMCGGDPTPEDVAAVEAAAAQLPRGEERVVDLMDALERSVADAKAERQSEPAPESAGVIMCGPGTPTDADRAAVAAAMDEIRAAQEDMPVESRGELGEVSQPAEEPEAPQADAGPDQTVNVGDEVELVDWAPITAEVAELVRQVAVKVPSVIRDRVDRDVKAMHWRAVDVEITEAGEPWGDLAPHKSPIDLRRMVVGLLRLRAFDAAAEASKG